ncbi:hypothetical protein [Quatrionicoccus australiensis]|uniref:hypothetical protein n=1 Tax=Quatrionicoccus australiensis TaxID=138118 RepID=UPI001CFAF793|nr:hypothetical protein [Quatrionicoccus australiensis]MCB4359576.1 hypothetical protein [Quatrionicoccus australiensis]
MKNTTTYETLSAALDAAFGIAAIDTAAIKQLRVFEYAPATIDSVVAAAITPKAREAVKSAIAALAAAMRKAHKRAEVYFVDSGKDLVVALVWNNSRGNTWQAAAAAIPGFGAKLKA